MRQRLTVDLLLLLPLSLLLLLFLSAAPSAVMAARPVVNVLMLPTVNADFETAVLRNLSDAWSVTSGIDIQITILDSSNTGTAFGDLVLNSYLKPRRTEYDIFQIDIVWPGDMAAYLLDLSPYLSPDDLAPFMPAILDADRIDGRYVALPFFTDFGLLYYRRDLLQKYGFSGPPRTWDELEIMARKILEGERPTRPSLSGFSGQLNNYEGLTCNFAEWLGAAGVPLPIKADKTIHFDTPQVRSFLTRFRNWVGDIISPTTLLFDEGASFKQWIAGNTVFMRSWVNVIKTTTDANVSFPWDTSQLLGYSTDIGPSTLGGWHLGVSHATKNPDAAAAAIKFLTSATVQKARAVRHGILPTIPALYNDADVCQVIPKCQLFANMSFVVRPSAQSSPKYTSDLSKLLYDNVHEYLVSNISLDTLMSILMRQTSKIIGTYSVDAKFIDWADPLGATFVVLNGIGFAAAVATMVMMFVHANHEAIKSGGWVYLLLVLAGVFLGYASILLYTGPLNDVKCIMQPWFLTLAFSVCMSTLCIKNWRTSRVFNNPMKGGAPTNIRLLMYIGTACLVNVALLLAWTIIAPPKPAVVVVNDPDAYSVCRNDTNPSGHMAFTIAVFLYNVGILVAGVWYAYLTRHVFAQFNDSHSIAIITYNTILCCIVGVPILYAEGLGVRVHYTLRSAVIFAITTVVLVGLFYKKLLIVLGYHAFGKDKLTIMLERRLNRPSNASSRGHQEKVTTRVPKLSSRASSFGGQGSSSSTGQSQTAAPVRDSMESVWLNARVASVTLAECVAFKAHVRTGRFLAFLSMWRRRRLMYVPHLQLMVLRDTETGVDALDVRAAVSTPARALLLDATSLVCDC
ncbi:hypothetical protein BC831DRAFT_468454 [Entophlyctis helioformis]|nr:hypothetical protein BC831DRAFT_468454 [Entophlyctis helioformis]